MGLPVTDKRSLCSKVECDTGESSGMTSDSLLQVPAMFDKEELREKLRKLPGGPTMPLNVHLRQELDRLNIVIKLTSSTLKNLRLAIAGTIALSGGLIDSLDALFNARIPQDWLKKSWEASTLGNWFLGLLQRYDQLNKWLNAGRPKAYWMTGFFNPQVGQICKSASVCSAFFLMVTCTVTGFSVTMCAALS